MKPSSMIESERIWRELEPLLDMCDRAAATNKPRTILLKDVAKLSTAYAAALHREARVS